MTMQADDLGNDELRARVKKDSAKLVPSHDSQGASSLALPTSIAKDHGQARPTDQNDNGWARHFRPWSPLTAEQVHLCYLT